MKTLAILPARGGSKRIPRKNIRSFLGRPIFHYAVEAARDSGCFDEIMVSTDDAEIAASAAEIGAQVPFLRSAGAADDFATTADVLREVLASYAQEGRSFDLVCCIYPTAALTEPQRLREGRDLLLADPLLHSSLSVLPFSYPIQRALRLQEGRLSMIAPEFINVRSQDLETSYRDAGQWYWFRPEFFRASGKLIGEHCAAVVLSEFEAQDIDTEEDWRLAELKHRLRRDGSDTDGKRINLRAAGPADARTIWELVNDRVVRSASFRSEEIPWPSHETWYRARLGDPSCWFRIVEDSVGEFLGYVRLDIDGNRARISVALATAARGKGLGAVVIAEACRRFLHETDVSEVEALIKPDNHASQKAFRAAGFEDRGSVEMMGIPACRLILTRETASHE